MVARTVVASFRPGLIRRESTTIVSHVSKTTFTQRRSPPPRPTADVYNGFSTPTCFFFTGLLLYAGTCARWERTEPFLRWATRRPYRGLRCPPRARYAWLKNTNASERFSWGARDLRRCACVLDDRWLCWMHAWPRCFFRFFASLRFGLVSLFLSVLGPILKVSHGAQPFQLLSF